VKTEKDRGILIGLAVVACAIVFLIFAAAPIQYRLGLLGMGITEIGLLAIAIGGCMLLRGGWREVFPFKKPRFSEIRGSIYIYIGVFGFTIGITNVLMFFFPGMREVTNALAEFFSEGGILLFVTVSLLPGFCEEMLFRGTIQSAFRRVKSTAAIVLIVSALFALFHLDLYRFLPTMILGAGLTYIMVKTGNLLYTMVLHALHNLIAILPILLGRASDNTAALFLPGMLGIFIIYCSVGALFLRLGIRRLNGKRVGGGGKAKRIVFNIVFGILILFVLYITPVGMNQPVIDMSLSLTVEEEYDDILHFEITTAGTYQIEIRIDGENVISSVQIVNALDEEVYNPGSGISFGASAPMHFEPGLYTCIITLTPPQTGESGNVEIRFSVKKP